MNFLNFSSIIELIRSKFNLLNLFKLALPIAIALYLYNPFDNSLIFYWDQSIVLEDKDIFNSSFFMFQERSGFGVYGYYINFIINSVFNFVLGPAKGMDISMILLMQAAFWGAYLFLKEITNSKHNWNIYLLALIYIVSLEAQFNVYRTNLGQNFLWGMLPLAAYLTIKVIRHNSIKWQFGLAACLFFLQVSFAHPTSIINYSFIVAFTLLLLRIKDKISFPKIVRLAWINIIIFLPILLQILLINKEVSGFIYNSTDAFGSNFILSWYELGRERFQLNNVFTLNYFLETQIRQANFNQDYLLLASDAKINQSLKFYSVTSLLNLGIFAIILLPIFYFRKGVAAIQQKTETLTYIACTFGALFGVAIMSMFQGPLLQLFGLFYKIFPSIFLLYRYLDAKFGVIFLLLILMAVASSHKLIENLKVKNLTNIFLLIVCISYLGFFASKFYSSPYGNLEIPTEYSSTCKYLKQNSMRTIKFPYSFDVLHFTEISDQKVLSNDVFNQNCNHPIVSIRTLQADDEVSITKLYNLMDTDPVQFKKEIQNFSIDTLVVDKKFVPNNNWNRIFSEEQKVQILNTLETNFAENKVLENQYFRVYKFAKTSPVYISAGQIEYQKNNPTWYNLNIKNLDKDAILEFQYNYANWNLTDLNSKITLSDSIFQHTKGRGFNNTWQLDYQNLKQNCQPNYCKINANGSLDLNLQLWYKPQIIYEEMMLVFILIVTSYLAFELYKKYAPNK